MSTPSQPDRHLLPVVLIVFVISIAAGLFSIRPETFLDLGINMEKMRWLQITLYLSAMFAAGYIVVAIDQKHKQRV
jgi:hypothetical protein